MIGYFRPRKLDLTFRQYEEYRKYYCAGCLYFKNHSPLLMFGNNYDGVFLSLIVDGCLVENKTHDNEARCPFIPIIKLRIKDSASKAVTSGAIISGLFFRMMLLDHVVDNKYIGKRLKESFSRYIFHKNRKMLDGNGIDANKIQNNFMEFWKSEDRNEPNFDLTVEPLCNSMGEIYSQVIEGADKHRTFTLGYNVLKTMFIIDAVEDFWIDAKKGKYNPFNKFLENKIGSLDLESNLKTAEHLIRSIFNMTLNAVEKAVLEIRLINNKILVQNILSFGVHDEFESALSIFRERKTKHGKKRLLCNFRDF